MRKRAERLLLILLAVVISGCELVADFDRNKIPLPDAGETDAAAPRPRDSGQDEPDAAAREEDAGSESDAG